MFRARRKVRFLAGVTLVVAAVLFSACEWPQARFGPGQTGFNPYERSIGAGNVSGLQLRWSAPVGVGATPTIANGALYLTSDKVYAFDASTGSARWWSRAIGRSHSSPSVAKGVVYVSGDKLYAFDAATGATLWSAASGVGGGAPAVANGVVYVSGDRLYAFDAATGGRLWSAATGAGGGPPAVANGVVYVTGDKLFAFDATSGAQRWSAAIGVDGSSPAVASGLVYVSGDKLYAFNATNGARSWSATVGIGGGAPAVANGVVFVAGDKLYALNAGTGSRLWSATNDFGGFRGGLPVVANGVVYASGYKGGGIDPIWVFDATTGARLWSDWSGGAPVIANGVVYVSGNKLRAYSLPLKTPQLSISPAFPNDPGFPDYAGTLFTITNIGSAPTSAITDSIVGPDAAHFALTADGCAGTRLLAGARCTVRAFFAPKSSGPRRARLTATAEAGGTATAILTGTGPPFTVSPFWLHFGFPFAGSTSTAAFTVTNFDVVPVGPITNSITAGSGFTITNDACGGRIIAAGTSCTVDVMFAPTTARDYTGAVTTRAAGHEAGVSLGGTGLRQLEVAPSSTDFGRVRVGATASNVFTVTNVSPTAAGGIVDTIENPNWFSITSDTCAGRALGANTSCSIVVTFAPTGTGADPGAILHIDAPSGGTNAGLYGTGT
jgi:outer membrane protein assembly factor BamB